MPSRAARRALAWALVLLCAWAPAAMGTDAPRDGLPPPIESRRLPPVVDSGGPQTEPGRLFGFEASAISDPYDATRQVNYVEVTPSGPAARQLDPAVLRGRQPLILFSGMQEPPPNIGLDEAPAEPQSESGEEPQTFGQAPTNNALQFLRTEDVLLKPGAWQVDTGFAYTLFANDFPVPITDPGGDVVDVVGGQVRRRLLYTPLAVRYGWSNNVQLFATMPTGFSNTQISTLGISETTNVSGIGDLTFGASIHLMKGECQMPDVIGTIGFTAPTGKFATPVFGLVPGSNLGQGFWAYSAQLLFIHRYDPIIVFYGGGYRHLWERPFDGVLFTPGEQALYQFGVGFSANDRVTLSTAVQGFYITNSFIEGENVRGSNLEPISIRFAATIVRDCRIIEPFAQIGATDSAPQVNVGVVVTFY